MRRTRRHTKVQVFLPRHRPGRARHTAGGLDREGDTHDVEDAVTTDDGTITDAVSEITWTGGTIGSGQLRGLRRRLRPVARRHDQLSFKTLQTYSDGTVVRWIEEPQKGGAEPESPAPVLTLTAKREEDGDATGRPRRRRVQGVGEFEELHDRRLGPRLDAAAWARPGWSSRTRPGAAGYALVRTRSPVRRSA